MSSSNIPQQVVDAILACVRTAEVDVHATPDGKYYTITVISPVFDNLAPFKRRDMVQKSLGSVRTEIPEFAACQITALHLWSPSEIQSQRTTGVQSIENH